MLSQKIILDTDIGGDIDDAYALALVLALKEIELVGVTTVFCNTIAGAFQALTILKIAGREDIPVAAGCGAVISPRFDYDTTEYIYKGLPVKLPTFNYLTGTKWPQHSASLPPEQLPKLHQLNGVEFLIKTILEGNGNIIPVTIGAMTNMALALVLEPRIAVNIPRIVCMAGAFHKQCSESNIQVDPVAADIVFNSGIPMTVIGLEVAEKCVLSQQQLDRLFTSNNPMAVYLTKATRLWKVGGLPVLYDVLAIASILRPDIITTCNGTVKVELSGEHTYGYTIFNQAKEGAKGPHDVCVSARHDEVVGICLENIIKGG